MTLTPAIVQELFIAQLETMMDANMIYLPEEWGSTQGGVLRPNKEPYDEWDDVYVENDKAVFHYGGGGPYSAAIAPFTFEKSMAKLRQWELMHTSNVPRFNWRGLAYGLAVDEAGNVFIIRGFNLYGAHRGDYDNDGISANKEGLPILWIGGERNIGPSDAAWDAFEMCVIAAENAERVRYTRILGHQEIIPGPDTDCPGTRGMVRVRLNRTSDVFRHKYGGTLPPPEPSDDLWATMPVLEWGDGWKQKPEYKGMVMNMQAQLANHGYKAYNTFDADCEADGLWGNGTQASLGGFQAAKGIDEGGKCGPRTHQALNFQ